MTAPPADAVGESLPIRPRQSVVIDPSLNEIMDKTGLLNEFDDSDGIRLILEVDRSVKLQLPSGVEVVKEYKLFPFISAKLKSGSIESLAKTSGITGIYRDQKIRAASFSPSTTSSPSYFNNGDYYPFFGTYPTYLNESTSLIGANKLWERGYTGKGVIIALLDTGIDSRHPNLDDIDDNPATKDPKILKEVSFVEFPEFEKTNSTDILGHGTSVASIAAGTGEAGGRGFQVVFGDFRFNNATIHPKTQRGVAPGAYLYNVKVIGAFGFGFASWIISGIEWSVENGADVISMSLGGYPFFRAEQDPMVKAVEMAVRHNVTVVSAAGNNGPGHYSIQTPGIAPSVITVGASYETGGLVYFSSKGPSPYDSRVKPDVIAPGAGVIAASNSFVFDEKEAYAEFWGTSASTPHVAGAVALLLEAFPAATPHAIKAALWKGAKDTGLDVNEQGGGLLDVSRAFEEMEKAPKSALEIKPPTKVVTPKLSKPLSLGELRGTKILVLGSKFDFGVFLNDAVSRGSVVQDATSGTFGLPQLKNFDLVVLPEPRNVNLSIYDARALEEYVRQGGGLLVIGDQLGPDYDVFTKPFGITWRRSFTGGDSDRIEKHPITEGVKKVFFPGPFASLYVSGEAKTVIYDPVSPGVAVWELPSTKGRVVAVSDDDLLNNQGIVFADNRKLGLNIVKWLSRASEKTVDKVHEIGVQLGLPRFAVNNSAMKVTVNLTNFGDFQEDVNVNLSIKNKKLLQNQSRILFGLQPRNSSLLEFTTANILEEAAKKITVTVNASITSKEVTRENNVVAETIDVLPKNIRTGPTPQMTLLTPRRIDSFTGPLITRYPGDFSVFNITAFSARPIPNASLRITGNVSTIMSFSRAANMTWHIGMDTGAAILAQPDPTPEFFIYGAKYAGGTEKRISLGGGLNFSAVQIVVPENAALGVYKGSVQLLSDGVVLNEIPVSVEIRRPKARVLFDDVFNGVFFGSFYIPVDAERLWGGAFRGTDVSMWWRDVARAGYDVDSLRQLLADRRIDDPWRIIGSGEYKTLVLHDTDLHNNRVGVFPELLKKGISIEAHFDGGFDTVKIGSLKTEPQLTFFSGIVTNFNASHPVSRNIQNFSVLGGVQLSIDDGVQLIATGGNTGNPASSGVAAASFKTDSQSKLVGLADSSLFELPPDFHWIFFLLNFNVTVSNLDLGKLAVSLLDYTTNVPPRISSSVDRASYEPGDSVTVKVSSSKKGVGTLRLTNARGDEVSVRKFIVEEGSSDVKLSIPGSAALGEYMVEAVVVDDMGDNGKSVVRVPVSDLTVPEGRIISPRDGASVGGIVSVRVSGDDPNLSSIDLLVDGKPFSKWTSPGERSLSLDTLQLKDGVHDLVLMVSDRYGNNRSVSSRVSVDNRAPVVEILSPSEGVSVVGLVEVGFSAVDENLVRVGLSLDGVVLDVADRTKYTLDTSVLADGVHRVELTAIDEAGNSGSKAVVFSTRNVEAGQVGLLNGQVGLLKSQTTVLGEGLLAAGVAAAVLAVGVVVLLRRRRF